MSVSQDADKSRASTLSPVEAFLVNLYRSIVSGDQDGGGLLHTLPCAVLLVRALCPCHSVADTCARVAGAPAGVAELHDTEWQDLSKRTADVDYWPADKEMAALVNNSAC